MDAVTLERRTRPLRAPRLRFNALRHAYGRYATLPAQVKIAWVRATLYVARLADRA